MNPKHYLNSIIIKILRDKNNIFFILLLVISTILLIGSTTFKRNIDNYIEDNINKKIDFRTLQVSNKSDEDDFGKSKLLNIEHVQDVYSSAYNTIWVESEFLNEKYDGKIGVKYLPKSTTINTLIGRTVNENDKAVAIIPKQFYPDSSTYNFNIKEENVINGESLIGKTITIKYYTRKFENMQFVNDEEKQKTLTVIGVYDNKEFMNYNNEIFVSNPDVEEIAIEQIPKSDEPNIVMPDISNYGLNVVVDSLENVEYVMQKIYSQGFGESEISSEIDEETVNTIKISCYIITGISITVIVAIISLYIRKKLIKEAVFIGVLRTSGYTKRAIKKQYICEILLTTLSTFAIGTIISVIVCIILKNTIFTLFTYIGYNIKIYFTDILNSLVILILTSIICSIYFTNEKLKNNIINLIESRE